MSNLLFDKQCELERQMRLTSWQSSNQLQQARSFISEHLKLNSQFITHFLIAVMK